MTKESVTWIWNDMRLSELLFFFFFFFFCENYSFNCNLFSLAIDHVGSKTNLHGKTSFSVVWLIVNVILLIPNLESAVRVMSSPEQ